MSDIKISIEFVKATGGGLKPLEPSDSAEAGQKAIYMAESLVFFLTAFSGEFADDADGETVQLHLAQNREVITGLLGFAAGQFEIIKGQQAETSEK